MFWIAARAPRQPIADFKTAAYVIDGQTVSLVDGYAEVARAPGSASKTVTQYLGHDSVGDMNGDGTPDVGFILTQGGGGSGTFYYAVVSLKTPDGYQGTTARFLGDRIAPRSTEIRNEQLIVTFADRKPGEPMTAEPSVAVRLVLIMDGATLKE